MSERDRGAELPAALQENAIETRCDSLRGRNLSLAAARGSLSGCEVSLRGQLSQDYMTVDQLRCIRGRAD